MTGSLPVELTDHGTGDVWGVTPTALTLAANAQQTGEWTAVRRYYDLQVLVTNYDPGWEAFEAALQTLCSRWLTPPLDRAAVLVTPESAAKFFAGAAYFDVPSGIANVLVAGQDAVAATESEEPAVMRRTDVVGYTEAETDVPILRSLGVIRPVADGFQLNRDVFESLAVGFEKSRSAAAAALLTRVLETVDVERPATLVDSLLSAFGIDPPDESATGAGALPVLVQNSALDGFVESLFDGSLKDAVDELQTDTREELRRLDRARGVGSSSVSELSQVEWPIPSPEAGVCAVASQRDLPLVAEWLGDRLDRPPLALLDELTAAGVAVTYKDGNLQFGQAYQQPSESDTALAAYGGWLEARAEMLRVRSEATAQVASHVDRLWERQRDTMISDALDAFEDWTASPTRFVYTIFDPEHHADQYDVDQYVGPSDDLQREVDQIRQWRENRRPDIESFAELVPEVLNHPLEYDDVDGIVRIMCPWTNFAVQDYTALFTRLLDNDVTIRLLMRLPTAREWRTLKSSLLSRLGDTDGNLELRSYTRYREFMDHGELRELDAESEQRRRTGVHAKLFVAGGPENGNVLAGSANLMENSFFYNPEAGIQTRNPNVIGAAIDYFDLVWKLASPDHIPEEAFTGDTEFSFYPRVYRPQ